MTAQRNGLLGRLEWDRWPAYMACRQLPVIPLQGLLAAGLCSLQELEARHLMHRRSDLSWRPGSESCTSWRALRLDFVRLVRRRDLSGLTGYINPSPQQAPHGRPRLDRRTGPMGVSREQGSATQYCGHNYGRGDQQAIRTGRKTLL